MVAVCPSEAVNFDPSDSSIRELREPLGTRPNPKTGRRIVAGAKF